MDSGNLAGHLLTLRAALVEIADAPIIGPSLFLGLGDTFADRGADRWPIHASRPALTQFATALKSASTTMPLTLAGAHAHLEELVAFARAAREITERAATVPGEALEWVRAGRAVRGRRSPELHLLVPWATLPAHSPGMRDLMRVAVIPSLRQVASLDTQLPAIASLRLDQPSAPAERERSLALRALVNEGRDHARSRLATLEHLEAQVSELAQMEYGFLSIRRGASWLSDTTSAIVDWMRATTTCLPRRRGCANFVAIAQGKLSQESWFALDERSRLPEEHRFSCRGAARCSST